jgi:hypothetical protein
MSANLYLGTVRLSFDLEPEVAQADRERVLRTLRDKVRNTLGHRVTVRTDDEDSVYVAVLDDNLERLKTRLDELADLLDNAGQARLLLATPQMFAWFEGAFEELAESKQARLDEESESSQRGSMGKSVLSKTIVYSDDDHDTPSLPLSRKGIRLPTRK